MLTKYKHNLCRKSHTSKSPVAMLAREEEGLRVYAHVRHHVATIRERLAAQLALETT